MVNLEAKFKLPPYQALRVTWLKDACETRRERVRCRGGRHRLVLNLHILSTRFTTVTILERSRASGQS